VARINAKADDVNFATGKTSGNFNAWDQSWLSGKRLPTLQTVVVGDGPMIDLLLAHGGQQLARGELAIAVVSMHVEIDAHGGGLWCGVSNKLIIGR
jgi:hypothetical protein